MKSVDKRIAGIAVWQIESEPGAGIVDMFLLFRSTYMKQYNLV